LINDQLGESEQEVRLLNQKIQSLEDRMLEVSKQLQEKEVSLMQIWNSRGYKFVQVLWKVRKALLPEGSLQYRIVRTLYRGVRKLVALFPFRRTERQSHYEEST